MAELNADELRATVARLEELLAKATPGPVVLMDCPEPSREDHGWRMILAFGKKIIAVRRSQIRNWVNERTPNLDLATESRNTLPALLAAIKALLEDRERLEQRIVVLEKALNAALLALNQSHSWDEPEVAEAIAILSGAAPAV